VDDALAWIGRIRPKRAILTNLHADLDYEALRARLPSHVEPAYDGITVELPDPSGS
jgi:phosphoribosyl 1,2-cyclic phosphate phosphodiesterase